MRRPLPIRWRLMIWYAALMSLMLGLLGAALYIGMRQLLLDSFNEQVQNEVALVRTAVQVGSVDPSIDPDTVAGIESDEHFIRLYAADGRLLVDATSLVGGVPDNAAAVEAARAGSSSTSNVRVGERTFRVETVPVQSGATVTGVLQVGASREDADQALDALVLAFLIATPVILLIAAGSGFLLAGRSLKPMAALTQLAGSIGADDLDARLNLDLPDDELGRLARTFDAMLARIEDAFERQRRFTGDAAHELRTPLSLMRSQIDLALTRPRSAEEYREALHALERDLERMTGLVGTLLMVSRGDRGVLPVERSPVDLHETIPEVLDQYEAQASALGISLIDASAPVRLFADEDLLIQVLVNLLDNALAHTPAGGTIEVGCREEANLAVVWVADTGIGIAPEHQARVFDRFYRVDSGRARDHGGVGLGLAFCRAIAEAHGGTITLTSTLGAGTRVELVLPVAG